MKDRDKSKEALVAELVEMRGKVAEYQALATGDNRVENGLQQSKEMYSEAYNLIPSSITVTTLKDGMYIYANDAFSQLSGYSREDLIGRKIPELGVWGKIEDRTVLIELLEKYGRVSDKEFEFRRKSGEIGIGLLSAEIVNIGSEPCIIAVITDITGHRKAEERVRESEEKFRLLAENSVMGTFIVQDSKMVYVNPSFADVFGYRSEEIIDTMGPSEFIHPDERDFIMQRLADRYAGRFTDNYVSFKGVKKDGSTVHIEAAGVLTDYRGKPAVMGTLIDITERKQAEEILMKSEQKLRALMNANTETVMLVDTEGTILAVNTTAAKRFGKRPDDLVGLRMQEYMPSELANSRLVQADKVRRSGKPQRFQDKRGGRYYDNCIYPVFNQDGKVQSYAVYAHDITELEEAREDLLQAKEFTETALDAQLDTFFLFEPATGKAVLWNKTFRETVGYTDEEIARMPAPTSYYSPEDLKRATSFTRDVLVQGSGTIELDLICKDGHKVPTEYRVATIRGEEDGSDYLISIGRDITERRKAEASLRIAEEKYRTMIETSPLATTVIDLQGKIIFASKQSLVLFGYENEEEVLGMHFTAFGTPENAERDQGLLRKVINGETVRSLISRSIKKDGSVFDSETSASAIVDDKGNPYAIMLVITDITERRQAEEALQWSQAQYQDLYDDAPVAYYSVGTDGVVKMANKAGLKFLGYSLEELQRMKFIEIYAEESKTRAKELFRKFRRGISWQSEEMVYQRKDGEKVHGLLSVSPNLDKDGRVLGSRSIVSDVTERHKAGEALRQSEEKFRLLAETSVTGIYILQDSKMAYVNPSFAQAFGYRSEEIIDTMSPSEFIHHDDRDSIMQRLADRYAGRLTDNYVSLRGVKKDGSIIHIEASAVLAEYRGRPAVMGTFVDITERRQIENALKYSEEKYRELADSITDVFFAMDEDLRYIYWNRASELLTGIRAKDAIGKSLLEIFPDSPGLRKSEEVYRAVLKTKKSRTFINNFDIGDKRSIFEIIAYPSRGGVSAFVRDITDHKQAEERLAGSERKFRSIFENAHDGIFLLLDDGTIVDANPRAGEIFGRSRNETLGLKPWDFSPPTQPDGRKSKAEALKMIKAVLEGSPQLFEWTHTRKDNSRIDTEVSLNLVGINGKRGILAITRDISERKQMEALLRETREAERARIARELHDAVSQTLSSAGLIADVLPRLWERSKSEGLKRLHELSSLTRDAQSEMRSLLYELYPAALSNRTCDELLHQLAKTIDRRIPVTIDAKTGKGCFLEAECKYTIYRITQEALSNITKHAMAKHVWITLSCRSDQVLLRIIDDGTGFDARKITQNSFGIRNMRQRAKSIGAQLTIKSTVGQGTEVKFKWKRLVGESE